MRAQGMTESCTVAQCGRVGRCHLFFLSSTAPRPPHLPLSCLRGWFNSPISVAPPIGCNLLAGGRLGAPSVRGGDTPNILTPFLPQGGQNGSPGHLIGKGKRGSLSGVQRSRVACAHPTPPRQVPERKHSLFQPPNQIMSYYAHPRPIGNPLACSTAFDFLFPVNGYKSYYKRCVS